MTAHRDTQPPFDAERLDEMRAILGQAAVERLLRALAAELAEAPQAIVALAGSGQHAAAAAAAHRLRGAVLGPGLGRLADILSKIEAAHGERQKTCALDLIDAAEQARDAIAWLCDRPAESER